MQAQATEHQFHFPTDWKSIYDRIQAIDPIKYASTRNFENGALTLLGPYISRGVISTKFVFEHVNSLDLEWKATEKLVQELAWRDYWQQIWVVKHNQIESDFNFEQKDILHTGVPTSIVEANTGIEAIDEAIEIFYKTGYLHNHMRMYIAAVCCNIGKYHWSAPANWMYANLLDGDLASNHLSWQWVAGTFSNRKYLANQENINKYSGTEDVGTFLDSDYRKFNDMVIPQELTGKSAVELMTILPEKTPVTLDKKLPTMIQKSMGSFMIENIISCFFISPILTILKKLQI